MHQYFIGEFLGTMTLTLFGCGVVANTLLKKSKGENGGWLCITTGWALAVIFGVFVAQAAGSVQADINPAVTLAKYYLKIYSNFFQVIEQIYAQIGGAFLGALIVWLAYLPHWRETDNQRHKLMVFATSPEIRCIPSNLLCEIIGTMVLVFVIGALSSNSNITAEMAPYFVGLLVWVIGLSLGGPTGYAINPARDLGPRLAHTLLPLSGKGSSEWSYALVPIVGPFVGGIIGASIWSMVFTKF